MQVDYRNTFLDVLHFNIHVLLRQSAMQIMALLSTVVLGYTVWSAVRNMEATMAMKVVVFTLMLSFVLGILLAVVLLFTVLNLFLTRSRHVIGQHTISFTDEGVVECTPLRRHETTWQGIHSIARTKRFILIFVSPACAHLVPTRAFASQPDAERFFELAIAKKNAPAT